VGGSFTEIVKSQHHPPLQTNTQLADHTFLHKEQQTQHQP